MNFWRLAFKRQWVTAEQLRGAVKTELTPKGEISLEQFKEITGEDFIKVVKPVEVPTTPLAPTIVQSATQPIESIPVVNPTTV